MTYNHQGWIESGNAQSLATIPLRNNYRNCVNGNSGNDTLVSKVYNPGSCLVPMGP